MAPLHLFIVRGPTGTIVRRWAADARLNGETFSDAWLAVGDHLSVGPIEFEVLGIGIPQGDTQPALAPFDAALAQAAQHQELARRQLDEQRQLLDEQRQTLVEQSRQVEQQQQQLAEQLQQLDTQRADLSRQQAEFEAFRNTLNTDWQQFELERRQVQTERQRLEEQARQLETTSQQLRQQQSDVERRTSLVQQNAADLESCQAELNTRLAQLETERQTLQQQREVWETALRSQSTSDEAELKSLRTERDQFTTERRAFESQRANWNAEFQQQSDSLDQQWRQLAAEQAELENLSQALAEQRQQWQDIQDQASQQTEATIAQQSVETAAEIERLQAEVARLSSDAQSLQQESARLQAENTAYQQASVADQTDTQAQFDELEKQRQKLIAEQQQFQEECSRIAADNQRQADALQAQADALKAEHETFVSTRQQWQTEQQAAERDLIEQRERLSAEQTKLQRLREDFYAEQQSHARQQDTLTSTPSAGEVDHDAEVASASHEAPEEPEFHEPVANAPISLADVLRRYGATVDTAEDEPAASESTLARPATPIAETPGREVPKAVPQPPAAHDHEDESIDDYMQRLMQRVRSTKNDGATPAYTPQAAETTSGARHATAASSTANDATVVEEPVAADEAEVSQSPRRVAPEKRTDLSALRELANLSAENALRRHSRRMLIHTMWSKLLVTAVALAAAIGLFWMWHELAAWEATFYAALVAILVAVCWGVKYAILIRRLVNRHWMHITMTGRRDESTPVEPLSELIAASQGDEREASNDATLVEDPESTVKPAIE